MQTSSQQNAPLLVIGATGILGSEICRQLIDKGKKVIGLVRATSDPVKIDYLKSLGVQTIEGDIKDKSSIDRSCQGVAAVISTASSTISHQQGDSIQTVDLEGQLNVVKAAEEAGVKHFVFISFPPVPNENPLQTAKRIVEQQLKESGIKYTILQPTDFMEVWLSPAVGFDFLNAKATIYGEGINKISWIAVKDVAQFAVASLDNPNAFNTTIELGGPEALSPLEAVQVFEEHGGVKFIVNHVPVEALLAQKAAATDPLQASFAGLMLGYAAGSIIDMKNTLQVFPVQLSSVRDYARRVMPAQPAAAI
jgi:NADH dehydrogenase